MTRMRWLASGGAALVALGGLVAFAQQGGVYEFDLHSIPGGGGTSAAADYELRGAIGQAFAGHVQGSGYVLDGGFYGGGSAGEAVPDSFELVAPGLSRQP
jgi:hypothetical protein